MRFLIILFLNVFLSHPSSELHDSVTATFHLIEKGHVRMLEIDFDTKDYLAVNTPVNYTITKEDFGSYLNKTTSWQFDGVSITPKILSLKQAGDHTKVVCFLSEATKNLKSIEVKNEFLLDIPTHSNIVMLDVNKVFKDFRFHKGRTEIKVDYQ